MKILRAAVLFMLPLAAGCCMFEGEPLEGPVIAPAVTPEQIGALQGYNQMVNEFGMVAIMRVPANSKINVGDISTQTGRLSLMVLSDVQSFIRLEPVTADGDYLMTSTLEPHADAPQTTDWTLSLADNDGAVLFKNRVTVTE